MTGAPSSYLPMVQAVLAGAERKVEDILARHHVSVPLDAVVFGDAFAYLGGYPNTVRCLKSGKFARAARRLAALGRRRIPPRVVEDAQRILQRLCELRRGGPQALVLAREVPLLAPVADGHAVVAAAVPVDLTEVVSVARPPQGNV